VLAGVLLHVIKTTGRIDCTAYSRSHGKRFSSKMENASIVFVGNFTNGNLSPIHQQRACVMNLAAAGRIKSSAIKDDRLPSIARERLDHASLEVVKKRIMVIKAVSHKNNSRHLN
jgi:hypothetical protein